jgi:flagellar biosynthetic protein FliR
MGLFQFQIGLVIFLFLNGHLMYIRALADSFDRIPLLEFPRLLSHVSLAELMARISGQIFVIAIQLGAPVLITLFLVDVIFGAIGKIAAQVNVHHESQPVKAFIGVLILIPSIAFIFSRSGDLLSQMIWNIYNVLTRFV